LQVVNETEWKDCDDQSRNNRCNNITSRWGNWMEYSPCSG
jgi:hypothetical protein